MLTAPGVRGAKWQLSLRVLSEGVIRASANTGRIPSTSFAGPHASSFFFLTVLLHLPGGIPLPYHHEDRGALAFIFRNLKYPVSSPDSSWLLSSCPGDQEATGLSRQGADYGCADLKISLANDRKPESLVPIFGSSRNTSCHKISHLHRSYLAVVP